MNWYKEIEKKMRTKGILINGDIFVAIPIIKNNIVLYRECPKCGYKCAVVFKATSNPKLYILMCQHCGKYTHRVGTSVLSNCSSCGEDLPAGRKKFCYSCRPQHRPTRQHRHRSSV